MSFEGWLKYGMPQRLQSNSSTFPRRPFTRLPRRRIIDIGLRIPYSWLPPWVCNWVCPCACHNGFSQLQNSQDLSNSFDRSSSISPEYHSTDFGELEEGCFPIPPRTILATIRRISRKRPWYQSDNIWLYLLDRKCVDKHVIARGIIRLNCSRNLLSSRWCFVFKWMRWQHRAG